jgi:heptose-I-phosphate ethanolaminephosphotransferase
MAISLQAALAEMKNYSQLHMTGEENLQVLKQDDTPQTVVLVIGESARRDRHQVYGAKVLNTPIMKSLEARNELDVFTDIITLHPHTVASVPVMLTKQKGLQGDNELVPSFVQVFKKAGYKVFWISNQASLGGSENRIGYYARTADVSHFFHIHNSNLPLAYDEEILSYFKNTFQDPAPKKLYVLHLQGSHYGFARRYPYSFSKFSDPYDNTLLYTDYLLGQFIETLKTEHKPDSLVYLSDHGLLLNECGREFTHFDNKQAFEIPFYVWTSPEWRKAHADLYQNLVKNKGARGSTQIVFDTLVDLGGISYNQYQPELSALNPKMSVGSRQVRTYDKLVDYDHSQNDKNCHLQELKY